MAAICAPVPKVRPRLGPPGFPAATLTPLARRSHRPPDQTPLLQIAFLLQRRRHDYCQKRLPPLLAADRILELEGANQLLDQLLVHAN